MTDGGPVMTRVIFLLLSCGLACNPTPVSKAIVNDTDVGHPSDGSGDRESPPGDQGLPPGDDHLDPGEPSPPLAITTTTLPGAFLGTAYDAELTASGGAPPYAWETAVGMFPAGLSLSRDNGLITGVPLSMVNTTLTVRVSDNSAPTAKTAEREFSITFDRTCATTYASYSPSSVVARYSSAFEFLNLEASRTTASTTELLVMDIYQGEPEEGPTAAGDFPLTGANYSSCGLCWRFAVTATSDNSVTLFCEQGGLTHFDEMGGIGGKVRGYVSNLFLQECTIEGQTNISTLAVGGDSFCINRYDFDETLGAF